MAINKICSVFGHSDLFDNTNLLKLRLEREFLNLILNENVTKFLFGGFGDFDTLCYEVVCELKKQFSQIERIYCVENERLMRPDKRPLWLKQREYEQFVYLEPDFKYWYKQIYYRNVEMIKTSDFVLFYLRKTEGSGAYKAYEYAKKIKKNIILI